MPNLRPTKEAVNSYFQGRWPEFYSRYLADIQKTGGQQSKAVCPFHADGDPSLSINDDSGLFHCFGCGEEGDAYKFYGLINGLSGFPEILQGIGQDFGINGSGSTAVKASRPNKKAKSQIAATYDYTDEKGELLFQVVRREPKGFRQRRPDGKGGWIWNLKGVQTVPYRLPEIVSTTGRQLIFICEGEKDADRVRDLGIHNSTGTTCPMGAGRWKEEYNQYFNGADVVLLPDKDEAGRKHVEKIARSLKPVARSVKVVNLPDLPDKGDVSDWIAAGGTKKKLEELIEACQPWNPEGSIGWEKPVLLDDFSLPEMELLPGILGEFCEAVSAATETPIEISTGMSLATVATASQGKFIVQVKKDYSEPVNIWTNVALESGNRKSSVLILVTSPLMSWESQQRFEMETPVREAESKWKNQEARLKSLRGRYGKAKRDELTEIEKEIRELEGELVEVPVMPKVWVQDITPEHLGTVMALHDEKMSILSAEGGIFEIIGGRYSRGVPNLDLFLQSHSGDRVRVDRGSRDPIYLEHPALSMGLSPQPEVLRSIANSPGFRSKGLLARFLYLLPKSRLGHRTLETEAVPQHIKEEYESIIHTLLNIEPAKDEQGNTVPYILHLKYSAHEEWLEFSRVVEKDLREGGRFENITDWAGKLPGAAIRLAGLLHCVEHPSQPWSSQISIETMREALGLASVFASHALKVFDLMGTDKSLEGTKKVWRWVNRERSQSFSKRDCYNALKGSFPKITDIEPLLDVLEERNYIASKKEKTGGRPSVTYTVHPDFTNGWS